LISLCEEHVAQGRGLLLPPGLRTLSNPLPAAAVATASVAAAAAATSAMIYHYLRSWYTV